MSAHEGDDVLTEFDHHDLNLMKDPFATYTSLREGCPVAHSNAYGGFEILSRYETVYAAAHQPLLFSSAQSVSIPAATAKGLKPIQADPPEHTKYRTLLAAPFGPVRARDLEPAVRAKATDLIDAFIDRGACDLAEEFARPLPTWVSSKILGIPVEDLVSFDEWVNALVFRMHVDPAGSAAALGFFAEYMQNLITERRADPGDDDVLTMLIDSEFEGEKFTDEDLQSVLLLLILGALDTTSGALAGAALLLNRDLDARRRLIEEPDLMPSAVEELLRLVSPLQSVGRTITEEVEFEGQRLRPDDKVLLIWASANRDPNEFSEPDRIVLDRSPNRHLAFGTGIHRCLGLHVGRMMVRVGIEEILNRIPDYRVVDEEQLQWRVGHARRITSLPIVFGGGG